MIEGNVYCGECVAGEMSREAFDALKGLAKGKPVVMTDEIRNELARLGYVDAAGMITQLGQVASASKELVKKQTKKSPIRRV